MRKAKRFRLKMKTQNSPVFRGMLPVSFATQEDKQGCHTAFWTISLLPFKGNFGVASCAKMKILDKQSR